MINYFLLFGSKMNLRVQLRFWILIPLYLLILFGGFSIFYSCQENFDEINFPKTGAVTSEPDGLFTVATQRGSMTWYMYDRLQRIITNQYMQYNTLDGSGALDHYEPNYGMFTDVWDRMYGDQTWEIAPLFYANHTVEVSFQRENPHKEGIARIWKAFLFQRMTDLYGDIPYFEAFKASLPKFDEQKMIYYDLVDQLVLGKNLISEPGRFHSFGSADLIYGGDVKKWEKFANSVLLRIALRVSLVDQELAQNIFNQIQNAPLIDSHQDSSKMVWDATTSNIYFRNPILVTEVFNNTRMSATIVDFLKTHSDPRLPLFVKPAASDGAYRGLPNGLDPNQQTVFDQNHYNQYSKVGPVFIQEDGATYNLSYAEVSFLRAEAAMLGYLDGDPAELYYQGIKASLEMYGLENDIAFQEYIDRPEIQYDPANGLEQIITQKWVALCMNGVEAWFEKRRTGFPKLVPLEFAGTINNGSFPRRLTYSDSERRLNQENLDQAVSRMGGDTQLTRVWWDTKP